MCNCARDPDAYGTAPTSVAMELVTTRRVLAQTMDHLDAVATVAVALAMAADRVCGEFQPGEGGPLVQALRRETARMRAVLDPPGTPL